jgi:hypothetical protein
MMKDQDIRDYIESGILEEYCLGTLSAEKMQEVDQLARVHPIISFEVTEIQQAFESVAQRAGEAPLSGLKEEIWGTLRNLNKELVMDPADLPRINRFSDHKRWLGMVMPFIPAQVEEERTVQVLRMDERIAQMLVISKTDFDDEVHTAEYESFIILEGECECRVGEDVFRLKAGGFAEIPLHTDHSVRIISAHVVAILQRIAV